MKLRIVLVGTSHAGNIGSVARAMKTFSLTELYLVAPKALPDEKSLALAANADDILAKIKIVPSIDLAVTNCDRVVGTSTRQRKINSICRPLRSSMSQLTANYKNVAILFGRENFGLSNNELDYCDEQIYIPANPKYSSLNLAQAVQVVAYEFGQNNIDLTVLKPSSVELASHQEFAGMVQHLEQLLLQIEFLNHKQPKFLLRRLRHMFNRSNLDKQEVNILRGIFTATQKKLVQINN